MKEADVCGGPIPERHGLGKLPTLVIEVGCSESLGISVGICGGGLMGLSIRLILCS